MKTDFTQTIDDAISQYRKDRHPLPRRPSRCSAFGHRALVHFAVSNDEVWMTTKLAGEKTTSCRSTSADDGGAGNPPNPDGSPTAYLWERVLQRDAWLNILGRFMHVETKDELDPITGDATKSHDAAVPALPPVGGGHRTSSPRSPTEGPGTAT